MKAGEAGAARLIDCIATNPSRSGSRRSAGITKLENPKRTPPTSAVATAATIVRVRGSPSMTLPLLMPPSSQTAVRRSMAETLQSIPVRLDGAGHA
jgi:hypothetical protein